MKTDKETSTRKNAKAASSRNADHDPSRAATQDALSARETETDALARERPYNSTKAGEHGFASGTHPAAGATVRPASRRATASTLSEGNGSRKTGATAPEGINETIDTLDRVRVDSSGRVLTTNQGVAVADNQNSLKYGERGPALLEDFILREKITHFDHERIPERIVHARGSGAHGYFECYESLADLTRAAPFQEAGKITPVFVRFSTVQGERGSKDTARDAWITPVTSLLISQRQMRTQCRFRLVSDFRG